MNKFVYNFLNIITLGIFSLCLKNKAKKVSNKINQELTYEKKYDFNIENFVKDLGGIENFLEVSSTLSTVKISLNDMTKIDSNLKQKYKINGLSKTKNTLFLVFGNNSIAIANDLNKILSK